MLKIATLTTIMAIYMSIIFMTIIVSMTIRAPWWAAASAAVGLFLYQTLDAIDGKQAR